MTATAPTERRTRRSTLFVLNPDQLIPLDVELPDDLRDANERAHAPGVLCLLGKAQAKHGELVGQADAAPRFDQLAAQAAIDAGEPPPKATAGAKAQKAEDARRVVDAAEQVAKDRTRALYDAMEGHHARYLEQRRTAHDDARAAVAELIPTILDRLPRLRREAKLLEAAEGWHNNPASASLGVLTDGRRDPAPALARGYAKALDDARKARRGAPVQRELPDVLAALTLLIEERT
jgi:hypothetical protein